MVLPLIPLAMWAAPAIAGAAATARAASSPTGQNIIRGGVRLADKGIRSLQNLFSPISQSYLQRAADAPARVAGSTVALMDELQDPENSWTAMLAGFGFDVAKALVDKKYRKKIAEKLGIDEETIIAQLVAEKEKNTPSIPENDAKGGLVGLKKGGYTKKKKKGYAKKQRKRKHYRASSFVKMKKKNKYIT